MTNIQKARQNKNIKKINAANLLEISLKSLYNYENGGTIPSDVLIKMSKLYECSIDYLLGLDDCYYSKIIIVLK